MRNLVAMVLGLCLAAGASSAAWASEEAENEALRELRERVEQLEEGREDLLQTYWRDGLTFEGDDFSGKIGGRIHLDYFQNHRVSRNLKRVDTDSWKPAARFRRARLGVEGDIAPEGDLPIGYKLELDFAGPGVAYRDVYMELKGLPEVGSLRIGHFKEPFSLEELTSSNNTTFIERALPNAFAPGRNLGLMVGNTVADDVVRWDVGLFRGFERAAGWNTTARIAASPVYEDEGEQVVHLGLAAIAAKPDNTVRVQQSPEVDFAPAVFDTDVGLDRSFRARRYQVVGAEAALVVGQLSFQGEYMAANVEERDPDLRRDLVFHGGYVQASYFLTPGDRRPYNRSSAVFGGVRPVNNFGENGYGAVEVAGRLSHLDLTNREVRGGVATNATLGANWYLNPNMKIMLNQVFTEHRRMGDAWSTLCRFQVAF